MNNISLSLKKKKSLRAAHAQHFCENMLTPIEDLASVYYPQKIAEYKLAIEKNESRNLLQSIEITARTVDIVIAELIQVKNVLGRAQIHPNHRLEGVLNITEKLQIELYDFWREQKKSQAVFKQVKFQEQRQKNEPSNSAFTVAEQIPCRIREDSEDFIPSNLVPVKHLQATQENLMSEAHAIAQRFPSIDASNLAEAETSLQIVAARGTQFSEAVLMALMPVLYRVNTVNRCKALMVKNEIEKNNSTNFAKLKECIKTFDLLLQIMELGNAKESKQIFLLTPSFISARSTILQIRICKFYEEIQNVRLSYCGIIDN